MVFDFALVLTLVATWATKLPVLQFLTRVIFDDYSTQAIAYMALLLLVGLPLLFQVNARKQYSTMIVRKLFHLLAFALFTPPLLGLD